VTFPADVPVLTDGVVTLRAHRIEDAIAVFEQCTDPVSTGTSAGNVTAATLPSHRRTGKPLSW
jgi:hypothetical protein